MNKSGIEPVGTRVLLLPDEIEERTTAGIIRFTPAEARAEQLAQTEGDVVHIGPLAWADLADTKPWAAVGDRVIFAKFAGIISEGRDGRKYRIVYDKDIVAIKRKAK